MRCVKTGDILAFTGPRAGMGTHFPAYLIRIFTMSEYSHVGIAYKTDNRLYLLEAQVPEIRMTPMGDTSNYYLIPMNIRVPNDIISNLLGKVGEKYSILEAIKSYFGFNNIGNKKWVCSEYVSYYLDLIGLGVTDVRTPGDVVKGLLDTHSKILIYVSDDDH